jgi:hypothetical protein
MTTAERFWSHVEKTPSCWIWTGAKRNKGYGAFVWSEKGLVVQGRAHRFSYQIHYGKIKHGLCVLHTCDVPACVNPSHLWTGTKADNNRDMVTKGRHVPGGTYCGEGRYKRGENHHGAKMTPELVRSLRKDRQGGMSFAKLGNKYGINQSSAFKIATGEHWHHVI